MLARHNDPIVAIATAPGRGAVGIVRVSGKQLAGFVRHLLGKDLNRGAGKPEPSAASSLETVFSR